MRQSLEDALRLTVITADIPDPLTGELDGQTIHIDYLLSAEERLFLLTHLVGYTEQWNLSPEGYALGQPQQPPVEASLLVELIAYEDEAAAYAVAMLPSVGIVDLDQNYFTASQATNNPSGGTSSQ